MTQTLPPFPEGPLVPPAERAGVQAAISDRRVTVLCSCCYAPVEDAVDTESATYCSIACLTKDLAREANQVRAAGQAGAEA